MPHIGQMLVPDLTDVVAGSDVLVLGSTSPAVIEALSRSVRAEQVVIDLVHLPAHAALLGKIQGLCW